MPAIAVQAEDAPKPPAERMGDKTFEDMLGAFRLAEKRQPETGDTIGEWIVVGDEMTYFQSRDWVEKQYRSTK